MGNGIREPCVAREEARIESSDAYRSMEDHDVRVFAAFSFIVFPLSLKANMRSITTAIWSSNMSSVKA